MRCIRPHPQNGDRRLRRIFLFFPRTVYYYPERKKETRWLEWAWVEEEYIVEWEGDATWGFRRFHPISVNIKTI